MTTVTRRIDPRTVRLTIESSPAGLQAQPRLGDGGHAVHARRDRGLRQLAGRVLAPVDRQHELRLRLLERRRGARPQRGGSGHGHHVPRDVHAGGTVSRSPVPTWWAERQRALPGGAEVYRTTAARGRPRHRPRLRLATNSTASALVLGLYADSGGQPHAARFRRITPPCGRPAGLRSPIANGPQLVAGQAVLDQPAEPGRRHRHPALARSRRGCGGAERTEREQLAHRLRRPGPAGAPGPTARCRDM